MLKLGRRGRGALLDRRADGYPNLPGAADTAKPVASPRAVVPQCAAATVLSRPLLPSTPAGSPRTRAF